MTLQELKDKELGKSQWLSQSRKQCVLALDVMIVPEMGGCVWEPLLRGTE